MWIIPFLLVPALFAIGMWIRAKNPVLGGLLIHLTGPLLVLNTLDTWAFQAIYPECVPNGLSNAYCPADGHFIEALGDLSILNLVIRFMLLGFGLDILAGWYLVHLCTPLFRRNPK